MLRSRTKGTGIAALHAELARIGARQAVLGTQID